MKFIAIATFLLAAPLAWSFQVQCSGVDTLSGAPVNGQCDDGNFTGFDTLSGSFLTGSCENGGDFEAYDSGNNDFATGNCDYDPSDPNTQN